MEFNRAWTQFAVDAEIDAFGTARLVKAHNALRQQLAECREAIQQEIEVSNCTYEFVDELKEMTGEDKEVLLSMVTVPGLKDALAKLDKGNDDGKA